MSAEQLRKVAAFQLLEVLKRHELSLTSISILMLAVTMKEITREMVMNKLFLSDTNAGVLLHRLKERKLLLHTFRGIYSPSKHAKKILSELSE